MRDVQRDNESEWTHWGERDDDSGARLRSLDKEKDQALPGMSSDFDENKALLLVQRVCPNIRTGVLFSSS